MDLDNTSTQSASSSTSERSGPFAKDSHRLRRELCPSASARWAPTNLCLRGSADFGHNLCLKNSPAALAQGASPKLGKSRHRRRQKAILAKVRVTSRASFSGNTGKLLQPVYASARWAPTDGSADFGHNLCLRNSPAALAQGVSPKLGKSRHRRRRKAFLAKVRVTSRNFSGNTGRGGGRSMPDRLQELATLDRLQAGPQGVVTPDVSAADLALQAPAAAGLANRCAKSESIIVTRVIAVGCGSLHDRKVRKHERMLRNFETGFER
ncbi:hypothetical protein BDZ88DRAFT_481017 [Geranomyces variabilis]|nr:hypothetical protein BDZ88DRAFT_481017 [Geranomyces variabilis]